MKDYTIADLSYNRDTGELEQFLIFWDGGEPDTRRATPENVLLFDPEDEFPFEGGLHDFLSGDKAIQVDDNPDVVVAQTGNEYSYIVAVDGDVIETTPGQAEKVLEAVYEAIADGNSSKLKGLHNEILSEQVRRSVIDALRPTFDDSYRISVKDNGWLVDNFFLVDWNGKMYTANSSKEGYKPSGNTAVERDTTHEFVRLRSNLRQKKTETVILDGNEVELTEREMLFLAKVTWLLNREHYHPNEPFWNYVNQWAEVESEEPNLDKFDL